MLVKIIPLFLALGLFVGKGSTPGEFKYIGSAKCKSCHQSPAKGAQYKKWEEGPHANALKSLKGDELKNPECLSCHTTTGHTPKEDHATIKDDEAVGCESCHGPGSKYKSMSIMKDRQKSIEAGMIVPDAETCKQCHNEKSPTFKGFDFDEYWAKIAHPNPRSK